MPYSSIQQPTHHSRAHQLWKTLIINAIKLSKEIKVDKVKINMRKIHHSLHKENKFKSKQMGRGNQLGIKSRVGLLFIGVFGRDATLGLFIGSWAKMGLGFLSLEINTAILEIEEFKVQGGRKFLNF